MSGVFNHFDAIMGAADAEEVGEAVTRAASEYSATEVNEAYAATFSTGSGLIVLRHLVADELWRGENLDRQRVVKDIVRRVKAGLASED